MELAHIFNKEVREFSEEHKLDGKQLEILKNFVDCRSGKIAKAITIVVIDSFVLGFDAMKKEMESW